MSDMRIVVDVKFEEICGVYNIAVNAGGQHSVKAFALKPRDFWTLEDRYQDVETVIYHAVIEAWQAANSAVEN